MTDKFDKGGWIPAPGPVTVRLALDECVVNRDGACIREDAGHLATHRPS